MTGLGWLAVAVGGVCGCWLRWIFGFTLNALFPAIPPGTLLANLVGGYVVGVAVGWFAQTPAIAPEWRLLVITGFCGGLTTFSSFSAELVALLQTGRLALFAGAVALHLGGSLAMTLLGIASVQWLAAR